MTIPLLAQIAAAKQSGIIQVRCIRRRESKARSVLAIARPAAGADNKQCKSIGMDAAKLIGFAVFFCVSDFFRREGEYEYEEYEGFSTRACALCALSQARPRTLTILYTRIFCRGKLPI